MSVKISRREEKRDTSIRDFALATVLPLLLTGLIGYFLGTSDKIDARVSSAELQQIRLSLHQAERQLTETSWLIGELDSLLQSLTEAHQERKEEFTQVVAQGTETSPFDSPLDNWIRAERRDYEQYRRSISELEGTVAGRKLIEEESVEPLFEMFQQLNQLSHNFFLARQTAFRGQTMEQREMTETLTEREEAFEDDVEDLRSDLDKAEDKLADKEELIALLQTKLTLKETPIINDRVSYQSQKATINAAITEIETITRQLPSGLLASKKKNEEIEAQIMKQVTLIENTLAEIE